MGRNKYNLSDDNHDATDGVVISIIVSYDTQADKVAVDVGRRNDVNEDELLHRLAQQVENAMRQTSKKYDDEMRFIELISGLVSEEGCTCEKGCCGEK